MNISAKIIAIVSAITLFHSSAIATGSNPYPTGSAREKIIRLNSEYLAIDKMIKDFMNEIKSFSGTTITVSVTKTVSDVRLLSVELYDNNKILKSHMYNKDEDLALTAGALHALHQGEIEAGLHRLRAVCFWMVGDQPPLKSEFYFPLAVSAGGEYFVVFNLERKGEDIELGFSQSEAERR